MLEGGERIALDRGHIGYSFAFIEDAEIFEDARVELRVGAKTVEGIIASIASGRIIIAVEEDFGEILARCILVIDNTALLEALKERLEKSAGDGRQLNVALANDVVANSGEAVSASNLPLFDVVIVDEASMVMLPALYYAAGLAREKVVVSGDFRQLPPIIATEQKEIRDQIGLDVFHAAGIVSAVESKKGLSRLVMLDEQHRMGDTICRLITSFMYSGKLRTSAATRARGTGIPIPLSSPLTIIDTSSLWPFETQTPSFSRYNLVHALVVRNLSLKLQESGHIKDAGSLGICTPYSAQAKLVRRLIDDEGLGRAVEAGTVHRYQGDEKTTIVIDIPESIGGGQFLGRFLQGDHPDDDGAKLFNVAISRAREHLVVVANLTYLDDRIPGGAFLRDILFQMQSSGETLDAREILTLHEADLRELGQTVDIDLEAQRTGLFGQKDFDTVF